MPASDRVPAVSESADVRWRLLPATLLLLFFAAGYSIPASASETTIAHEPAVRTECTRAARGLEPRSEGQQRTEGKWTLLFYDDADFYGGYDPFYDFCPQGRSGRNLDVIVLQDNAYDTARLWYVDSTGTPEQLSHWWEVNMGDGETLRNFIEQAKARYPADRYLLALYDHGGAWRGCCRDDTNQDYLTMDELRQAITDEGGVDVLCFTAPCLMGAFECAYELRACTEIYMGSEQLSGYYYWINAIGPLRDLLELSGTLKNEEIGQRIIQCVSESEMPIERDHLTLSAIRTCALDALAGHLDALAGRLLEDLQWEDAYIAFAREETHEFGLQWSDDYEMVDLFDFARLYAQVSKDPFALEELAAIQEGVEDAVIAECHGEAEGQAHGLSIYFPETAETYEPRYGSCALDFAADTRWDTFVGAYAKARSAMSGEAPPRLAWEVSPNPMPGGGRVSFAVEQDQAVTLSILDAAGRIVRRLHSGPVRAGAHDIGWDGRDACGRSLAPGVYFVSFDSGSTRRVRKVQLLR